MAELSKEEFEQAKKERDKWETKATYWHNAIPIFNYTKRGSLTEDVQTVCNFEQLELNKELSNGVRWNNRLSIIISSINLLLFGANMILLFMK